MNNPDRRLKLLPASCEQSSAARKVTHFICPPTPPQAAGEALAYQGRQTGRPSLIIYWVIIFLFYGVLPFSGEAHADMAEEIQMCAARQNKQARLDCYDNLAKRHDLVKAAGPPASAKEEEPAPLSMLEKLYELTEQSRQNAPMIEWHNPDYFLVVAFNTTPNRNTMLDVDPRATAQNTEAKFQLSGKVRPLPDNLLGRRFDFWVGYTQRSFWQLYNAPFSSPFRDTNYEPEGFLSYHTGLEINLFGLHLLDLRVINAGLVHQSNGRSKPLSRSWNRLYAEFCFERVFDREQKEGRNEFDFFVKPWYRLPENKEDDDNPDISRYLGYGEVQGIYYWKDFRFAMMLRNNLRASSNKGALQLEASMPFGGIPLLRHIESERISFFLQYFNGYGETLLDYNSSSNRISAGIMINNWE